MPSAEQIAQVANTLWHIVLYGAAILFWIFWMCWFELIRIQHHIKQQTKVQQEVLEKLTGLLTELHAEVHTIETSNTTQLEQPNEQKQS